MADLCTTQIVAAVVAALGGVSGLTVADGWAPGADPDESVLPLAIVEPGPLEPVDDGFCGEDGYVLSVTVDLYATEDTQAAAKAALSVLQAAVMAVLRVPDLGGLPLRRQSLGQVPAPLRLDLPAVAFVEGVTVTLEAEFATPEGIATEFV